ncbi:unnamed protein product [Clavelina lepadiformis]
MKIERALVYFLFITACVCSVILIWRQCATQKQFRIKDFLKELAKQSQPRNNHGIEFLNEPYIQFRNKHCIMTDATSKNKAEPPSWAMVTLVKSAARDIERRKFLRRMWASLTKVDRNNFYTVFVIGKPNDTLQDTIQEEIRLHHDILQMSTPEDYQINGLKTLAGMKWASENLPSNYYYSTLDDDMWIDMLYVKELIDQYKGVVVEKEWPEFPIICMFGTGFNEPNRDKNFKNHVSKEQYPWPYWPAFCFGGMYTTSVSVIKQLWELSTISRPLLYNANDVWITGLLRDQLEMPDEMLIRPKEHAAKHYR